MEIQPGLLNQYGRASCRRGYIYLNRDRSRVKPLTTGWLKKRGAEIVGGRKVNGQKLSFLAALADRFGLVEVEDDHQPALSARFVRQALWLGVTKQKPVPGRHEDEALRQLIKKDPDCWEAAYHYVARQKKNLVLDLDEYERFLEEWKASQRNDLSDPVGESSAFDLSEDEIERLRQVAKETLRVLQDAVDAGDLKAGAIRKMMKLGFSPGDLEDVADLLKEPGGRLSLDVYLDIALRESLLPADVIAGFENNYTAQRFENCARKVIALRSTVHALLDGEESHIRERAPSIVSIDELYLKPETICLLALAGFDRADAVCFLKKVDKQELADYARIAVDYCLSPLHVITAAKQKWKAGKLEEYAKRTFDSDMAFLSRSAVPEEARREVLREYRAKDVEINEHTLVKTWPKLSEGVAWEVLGAGNFASVYKVQYVPTDSRFPTEAAFKPLTIDRRATVVNAQLEHLGIDEADTQSAMRELATQAIGDLLVQKSRNSKGGKGFPEHLFPHPALAYLSPANVPPATLGILMVCAEGKPAEKVSPDVLLRPEVRRQAMWGSIADAICGQSDRNPGNYLVRAHAQEGDEKVTFIDNMTCFGQTILDPNLLAQDVTGLDHVRSLFRSLRMPAVIDQEMYHAIMAITKAEIGATLAGLLTAEEIVATAHRLAALQEHAEDLAALGWVIPVGQWGSKKVRDRLAVPRNHDYPARDAGCKIADF